jgi:CheY-like chemotaxis protein
MNKLKVLIVEDEMIIAWDLKRTIERLEHEVLSIASSADAAVEQAKAKVPDLILMDISLKGKRTGIDAAVEIRGFSQASIFFLTGNSHLFDDPAILASRAQGMYAKPPSESQLREMLAIAGKEG